MIFQHTYKLILRPVNPKTNFRRLCKRGDYATYDADGQIDAVYTSSGCLKWRVGNTYAVQPGRGKPALWISPDGLVVEDIVTEAYQLISRDENLKGLMPVKKVLRTHGYRESRIRITAIRHERVQDITEADVQAEGCVGVPCGYCNGAGWYLGDDVRWDAHPDNPEIPIPVQIQVQKECQCWNGYDMSPDEEYRDLWDTIHTAPGTTWADNPRVWVLEFERVAGVAA